MSRLLLKLHNMLTRSALITICKVSNGKTIKMSGICSKLITNKPERRHWLRFEVSNGSTGKMSEICSKLIIKKAERRHWLRFCVGSYCYLRTDFTPSSVVIVEFEQVKTSCVVWPNSCLQIFTELLLLKLFQNFR